MQYFLTPQQDGWGWSTLLYSPICQCAKVLVGKNVKVFDIFAWLCISDIKYSNILSVHFRQKTYQFSISELTGLSGYWTESRELLHHQRTAGWGFNWIVGTGTQTSYCCSQGTWPTSYAALPAALQTTHCNCTQTRHGQFYADQTDRYHIKARMLHCSAD